MNIDTRRAIRLALAPVACALLVTACATYEHEPYPTAGRPPIVVPPPLSTFDRLDTNRDGYLSRAEIEPLGVRSHAVTAESATAAFHRLDMNGDGFLSRAEANVMLGIPGWTFDAADQNRDGFLTLAEAMPHLRWLESRGHPAYPAYPSFEALDVDRDGFLNRAEAEPLISAARWVDGRWVMAGPLVPPFSFDGLDLDRDGFLTRAEAAPVIGAPAFDRADTNRDGFLSRGEVELMHRSNVGATYGPPPAVIYGPR